MKKKPFSLQRWVWIAGVPAALSVVLLCARSLVSYADLPKEVAAVKEDVVDLKSYVAAQQTANEINSKANAMFQQRLEQQQYQQQPQPYCEVYEGVLWCLDDRTQQWYQPQGGQ